MQRKSASHPSSSSFTMMPEHIFDSEPVELYEYSPLSEEAQEIRLLTLLPGIFSSEIRLRLDITPSTKSHFLKFEAVSYTWGSAENPMNIFIREPGKSKTTRPPRCRLGVDGGHTNRSQQAVAGARIYYFVCTNVCKSMYIGT